MAQSYEDYLAELESKLNWFEKAADATTGIDDRLDIIARMMIQSNRSLAEAVKLLAGIPSNGVSPEPPPEILPLYNVRTFPLDTARTDLEISIPGDTIVAHCTGSRNGLNIKLDSNTADAIPLNKFGDISYKDFKKFYLTTNAQAGETLTLFIGRKASASTQETTDETAEAAFYTTRSDKDTHFSGAIAQYAKEDESLTGLVANKIRLTSVAILADQNLDYWVMLWKNDQFDNTDLDTDAFIGMIELDLSRYGNQVGGTGQYYMSLEDISLDYIDADSTNELHISLYNASATAKTAGAAGEVVLSLKYEIRE